MRNEGAASIFINAEPKASWAVVQRRFSVKYNSHYESLFTIGSGYINVRASLPEGLSEDPQNLTFIRFPGNVTLEKFRKAKSKWGVYVPGFMERHPLLNEEVVNLPFFLGLSLKAGPEKLDMEKSRISNFCHWIDLSDGCVHRTFEWQTRNGARLQVGFHAYAHMGRRQLVVQNLSLKLLRGNASLTISGFIDGDVRTNGFDHYARVKKWGKQGGTYGLIVETHEGKQACVVSSLKGLKRWKIMPGPRAITLTSSCPLKRGQTFSLDKLNAVCTSLDASDPRKNASQVLLEASRLSPQELYAQHRAQWEALWARADMEIEGDSQSTLALRFSIYHMLRANPRNPRAAICAKMNGGDAYWGRIHWDNEVFIAPFFLYTLPAWARPLFEYRYKTLDGARQRARSLGYPGAMYAWESGSTGKEECPSFQYADHEVHISSDVALGLWHYLCATNDEDFLTSKALEVIFEVARYWMARCDRLPNSPFVHILCTMGPDEYSHASNDNAYTNFTAARTLLLAAKLYKALRPKRSVAGLIKKLRLKDSEARLWEKTARQMYIPYDSKRKLVLQSSDFEWKAPIDFNAFWRDRSRPFGQFVSQERLYRVRALKQADVLMLVQLFPTEFSFEEIKKALSYYEPYTTHDSSLSVATHSIICARLGLAKKAWEYFLRARSIDLAPGVYDSAEGIHAANAGALWQCVVFGFAGLMPAYLTDTLTLSPRLPRHWKTLSFSLVWHGVPVRLRIQQQRLELHATKAITVCIGKKTFHIKPDKGLNVEYPC